MNYVWTISPGGVIIDGQSTNAILAVWNTPGPHWLNVNYTTPYGYWGIYRGLLNITVKPTPVAPVITLNGDMLTSNAPSGNQWCLESAAIPGATGQTYMATQNVEYWVVVTVDGCDSEPSNHLNIVITGIEPEGDAGFSIHPVPNDGRFYLVINIPEENQYSMTVYDLLGSKVFQCLLTDLDNRVEKLVDITPVKPGIYFMVLQGEKGRVVRRMVVR